MSVPEWANERLSSELAVLRARGESQNLEYMVVFPQQARDLGKEIAAFATSNAGVILLGVSDEGDLVGLNEISDAMGRDILLRRLEGICRGQVKPSITPTAHFAVEEGRIVLVIQVPKGGQPVYFCQHIPYVRHLTESRPAEPHEVIELVQRWLPVSVGRETERDPSDELAIGLAPLITDIIIYGDEITERRFNPWLHMVLAQFRQGETELREIAAQSIAEDCGLSEQLERLANPLDRAASHRFTGAESSREFSAHVTEALTKARVFKKQVIDPILQREVPQGQIAEQIRTCHRRLDNLVGRFETMAKQARTGEAQGEASDIGHDLLRAAHYGNHLLESSVASKLTKLARDLHLVETAQLFMDGGRSMQALCDRVFKANTGLAEIVAELEEALPSERLC